MKMTLSVLLGGQGTEKYGDAPPPHPRQQNKIRCLTSATKSDASHLPILLHDGDKKTRAAWEATSPEGESQGNDERTGGGGGGAARAAMPALPVEERGKHQHRLCHFPTAVNICDHGATRETMSAGGGGGHRATTKTHPVDARAIDTASSATAATEQSLRQETTSMRGMQCAARAATPRPSVDASQDMQPPRPKYDSPPSCRKKRWAKFTAQSSPSPSSSLEAAVAAAVPPLYSPRRPRQSTG